MVNLRVPSVLCILLITVCYARNSQEFVVSYVNHPQVKRYKDLIVKSYKDIGIEVVLVETPLARRLLALNDGIVDADVGALDLSDSLDNVVRVEPKLYDIQAVLTCRKELICSDIVINDEKIPIYIDSGLIQVLNRTGVLTRKKNVWIFNRFDALIKMILTDRVDYLIMALDPNKPLHNDLVASTNMHILQPLKVYHHINKSNLDIVPELSEAIKNNMANFN